MADNFSSTSASLLNPTAPTFTMPSASMPENESQPTKPTNGEQSMISTANEQQKKGKKKQSDPRVTPNVTGENTAEAGAGANLTGAELKKQKAALKLARRAEKVAEKGAPTQQQQVQNQSGPSTSENVDHQRHTSQAPKREVEGPHHRRTPSMNTGRAIPLRPQVPGTQQQTQVQEKEKPQEEKKVAMFSHLYPKERKASLAGAGREIHPAVLALGLQLRDYVICGANARCVAMLLVFKKVIQAYTTPPGVALSRHLTTHLSYQITYVNHARPLSISQGNSIRWLKKLISTLDPDLAESEAKTFLLSSIDQFIRERITLADEVIAREAGERIVDGDVILTYAKSSVVEKTLITAHRSGKKFTVIVVDSRPLFEGKNHARSLVRAGLDVQYCLLSGVADVTESVTKCFLGASAMLGNGRLSSRAGTAMVAMMAKDTNSKIPVIVLCETLKFTARVALDSVIMNEMGEVDALVELVQPDVFTVAPLAVQPAAKGGRKGKDETETQDSNKAKRGLDGWRDQQNLYLLSLMYDVTPAEYLDMVISELGSLPPQAVPVVNGVHGGDE